MKALRVLGRVLHLPDSAEEARSGQAIFLIGVSAMVLIAIMGLAIDGGRLLFLSRETQNAADAAAIAAARAMCRDDPNYETIGRNTARVNGFDNNDEDVEVEVNVPPTRAAHDKAGTEDCIGCYVEVIVTGRIPASFIGLVYDGPLEATSYAVGACNPNYEAASLSEDELPPLRAAFNISPDTQCTLKRTGSTMYVIGGMHANGTLMVNATGQVIGPVSWYGDNKENANNPQYCPPEDCGAEYDDLVGGGSGGSTTAGGTCKRACFEADDGGGGGGGGDDAGDMYPEANPFQVSSPLSDPLGYNIADYAPGGTKATEAEHYYSYISPSDGNCNKGLQSWLDNKKPDGSTFNSGLYYTNCDIGKSIKSFSHAKGNITLVTSGTMHLDGDQMDLYPYMDDLLLFANGGSQKCPAGHALQVSGNDARYNGNLYAPNGEIKFSASSSVANSCLVGYGIDLSGAGSTINCEAGIPENSGSGEPASYLTE